VYKVDFQYVLFPDSFVQVQIFLCSGWVIYSLNYSTKQLYIKH